MSKANPLTKGQKNFIDANHGEMFVKDIAAKLNTTKGKIWRYISLSKKAKSDAAKSGYFNVNEHENWIA